MEGRRVHFPEPEVPDLRWARYGDTDSQSDWLDRSTLPRAVRIREFLNRSLDALPNKAADNLAHRFRFDPPFGRVFFELVVGRFLQVLGATVEHEPVGRGGKKLDWRATFDDGSTVLVEATSPAYNAGAAKEHRRREALLGVIEAEAAPGWWIYPRELPKLGLNDARRDFRSLVRRWMAALPDQAGYSFDHRLVLDGIMPAGRVVLELWPGSNGRPTQSPIAMVSMGMFADDSALRVAVAAEAKRRQARAFPGEVVLVAIDAPFDGPDLEDFDTALLGSTSVVISPDPDRGILGYRFEPDGALSKQRRADYAGVLAFDRVGMFGAKDPTLYRHPRFEGSFPAGLAPLRRRMLEGRTRIVDTPAIRTGIVDAIGFPRPDRLDKEDI
jgi:hypothetical protein